MPASDKETRDVGTKLHRQLESNVKLFLDGGEFFDPIKTSRFVACNKAHLTSALTTLGQHQGWSKIISVTLFALTGVGAVIMGAAFLLGKRSFYKTESHKLVEQAKNKLNNIVVTTSRASPAA